MVKPRRLNDRHLAYYVVGSQVLLATIIPLITLLVADKTAALAALSGGWIATIANAYFAIQAFRYSGASASSQMLKAFYRGETGKFVIVMLLFIAAFRFLEGGKENALLILLAFVLVQSVAWLAPLFLRKAR